MFPISVCESNRIKALFLSVHLNQLWHCEFDPFYEQEADFNLNATHTDPVGSMSNDEDWRKPTAIN